MSRNGPAIQFSSSTGFMMKLLVLILATVAFASASLSGGKDIDIKEDGTILIKSEDGKQIHITKQRGPYGQKNIEIEVTGPNNFVKKYQFDYNNQVNTFDENQDKEDMLDDTKWNSLVSRRDVYGVGELLNKMTQDKQDRLGIFRTLFKGQGVYSQDYNQNNIDKIFNVVMKIFDRQVLRAILIKQQQMYNQEIYGQYTNDKTWDMVLSFQGVFDHKYLVEILNNEILRTIFVQHGLFNKAVLNQIFETYETKGVYDPILLEQLVNTQMLKHVLVNRGISVRDILEQTSYNQNNIDKIFNVVMKIFDRQVLRAILIKQQQMYNQEIYGQYTNDKTWDMVLSFQGVFDHKYLVEILNNEILRTIFVQHGLFNKAVLNQIFETYETKGVYDPILLEQLVNTQMLKHVLVNRGISVRDILEQTSFKQYFGNTIYTKDVSAYTMMEKIISEPMWRDFLVQRGIFNKDILDQLLYRYNIQGVVDTILLRQLVNKRALYSVLTQYGVVDENTLGRLIANEFLGLNFLYRNNFFQPTPRMTYNNLFRVFGNVPEFGNMQMDGGKFLKNMLNGHNAGPTTYGRFYHQYPLTQRVY